MAATSESQGSENTTASAEIAGTTDRVTRTRRGFLGALAAALLSAVVIGVLWLVSRGGPSAGRDPALTPPTLR